MTGGTAANIDNGASKSNEKVLKNYITINFMGKLQMKVGPATLNFQ